MYTVLREILCTYHNHNTRAALSKAYTKKYVGIVRIGVRMSGLSILTTKYTLLTSIPHKKVFVPMYLTFHENFQSSVPVDREAIWDISQQIFKCKVPNPQRFEPVFTNNFRFSPWGLYDMYLHFERGQFRRLIAEIDPFVRMQVVLTQEDTLSAPNRSVFGFRGSFL